MKKSNLPLLISAMVFSGALIYLTSCQKQQENQIQNNSIDKQSREVTHHILDFKARMEYYRQNPNMKTEGKTYTADSAALELESLLNFDFCYTDIECNNKIFETSEIILPLDILSRINDPNLMQVYYDKIIGVIQAQMAKVNFAKMKLLLVDLEVSGYDSNGDAIISVGSLIGNEQNIALITDGWIYGENAGLCVSGWHNDEDAATQLDARVTNAMIPDPPSGCRWFFSKIVNKTIPPTQDALNNPLNNDRDYKIFYASNDVAEITDQTKCLYGEDMNFYESHYNGYAQFYETETGKKFSNCVIIGEPLYNPYQIQHNYTIFVGNRFTVCSVGVGDVMAVE